MDEEWHASPEFWRYYFRRLASCRFNRFTLIYGFDTGYLTPPYPFFVEVPGYPGVRVRNTSEEERHGNLIRLRAVIDLAHEHGIEFFLGTWQQTPWAGDEEVLVENLPDDEEGLAGYCVTGLKVLLQQLPALDGLHLRINHESGVGSQASNESFWRSMVEAAAHVRTDLKLDLRAKGLSNRMIADALATGLRLTVPTKYWCEHAGLPYHLTEMRREELTQLDNLNHSRRYSYSDMLRRPRPYDLIYRLWNWVLRQDPASGYGLSHARSSSASLLARGEHGRGALFPEHNHRDYRYMKQPVSYQAAEPSDPGLFYGIDEYVLDTRSGQVGVKYTPHQVRDWLLSLATETRSAVERAEEIDGIDTSPEWSGTKLDFLMLAALAEYHGHKIAAAVSLARHQQVNDPARLVYAYDAMTHARDAWRRLADLGSAYHDKLVFQAGFNDGGRQGHWRDWLPELDLDVERLERLAGETVQLPGSVYHADAIIEPFPPGNPETVAQLPKETLAGRDLDVTLCPGGGSSETQAWTLHYRHANQLEGPFHSILMKRRAECLHATLPGSYISSEWDLLLFFSRKQHGHGAARAVIHPGLWHPVEPMPYFVVRVT